MKTQHWGSGIWAVAVLSLCLLPIGIKIIFSNGFALESVSPVSSSDEYKPPVDIVATDSITIRHASDQLIDIEGGIYRSYIDKSMDFGFLYPSHLVKLEWEPIADMVYYASYSSPELMSKHYHNPEVSVVVWHRKNREDLSKWIRRHSASKDTTNKSISDNDVLRYPNVDHIRPIAVGERRGILFTHSALGVPMMKLAFIHQDYVVTIGFVDFGEPIVIDWFVEMVASSHESKEQREKIDIDQREEYRTEIIKLLNLRDADGEMESAAVLKEYRASDPGDNQVILMGYKLPWESAVEHTVKQAWNNCGSHCAGGSAAYAYDFDTSEGEHLLATRSGTVSHIEKAYNACGGSEYANYANRVVIDHPDGKATLYLHMQRVYVQEGQQVDQGTVIGTSGKTGWTDYSGSGSCFAHLHFQRQEQGGWWEQSTEIYFDEYPVIKLTDEEVYISANSGNCMPSSSGNWIVDESCVFVGSAIASENVIVLDNSVLTIADEAVLDINFQDYKLVVVHGSGIGIENDGKIY